MFISVFVSEIVFRMLERRVMLLGSEVRRLLYTSMC